MRILALVASLLLTPLAAWAQTSRIVPRLQPQTVGERLFDATLSADGTLVVTRGDAGVRVWSATDGAELYRIPIADDASQVAVAMDRDVMAIGLPILYDEMGEVVTLAYDSRGTTVLRREDIGEAVQDVELEFLASGDVLCSRPYTYGAMDSCWLARADTLEGNSEERFLLSTHDLGLTDLSPDGTSLLSILREGDDLLSPFADTLVVGAASIRRVNTPNAIETSVLLPGFDGAHGRFAARGRFIVAYSERGEPLSVWSAVTGERLLALHGLTNLWISPTGTRYLASGADGLRLWDASTGFPGRRLATLDSLAQRNRGWTHATFSPEASRLLTWDTFGDRLAALWNAETGARIRDLPVRVQHAQASGRGERFLTRREDECGDRGDQDVDRLATVWDWETGREVSTLRSVRPPGSAPVWFPVGSNLGALQTDHGHGPDGHTECRLIVRSSTSGAVLSDGEPWTFREGDEMWKECPGPIAVSPDETTLLLAGSETLLLWPASGGDPVRIDEPDGWLQAQFSPDGARLIVSTGGLWDTPYAWSVRDATTGARLDDAPEMPLLARLRALTQRADEGDGLYSRGWSAARDLSRLVVDLDSVYIIERASGEVRGIDASAFESSFLRMSPDGRFIAFDHGVAWCDASPDGLVTVIDASTGAPRMFDAPDSPSPDDRRPGVSDCSSLFSPDGRHLVSWTEWSSSGLGPGLTGVVSVWDIETGRLVGERVARSAKGMTPDSRFIYLSDPDGRLVLWSPWTGEALSIFLFEGNEWAVLDSHGRYDASNAGDIDGLLWILDTPDGPEAVRLSQFKALYYEPKLLARHLGLPTARGPHRDVSAVQAAGVALYPRVEITAVSAEAATIRLTDRGGGIGPVQVLVNGTEILADARGRASGGAASDDEVHVDLSAAAPFFLPGANVLEVVVSNADGSLRSRRVRAPFEVADARGQGPEGRAPEAYTPHLWAVVVGTSDYLDDGLDLSFAAKDAVDIAEALRIAGGRLLSPERTHVTLLSTESDDPARWPTREGVLTALDSVATQADPRDVLVVYLSGHGIVSESSGYTYLTHEAVLTDGGASGAISSDVLTGALKRIPALKRVLILDTCASGSVVDDLSVVRATDGDQTRSLDRLKDRTGTFVLAGSTADRPSYEASQYAQGLLTWSLLDGIRGAALREGGEVDVARLFGHALDTVPSLARGVGGVQAPTMAMPSGGGSFPIGRVTEADRARIPLNAPRAVVTPVQFIDADAIADDLGLALAVNVALRDAAAEPLAPLVFRDVQSYPGALAVRGLYSRNGDRVDVRFKLSPDAALLIVSGLASDLDALAAEIVERIAAALRGDG